MYLIGQCRMSHVLSCRAEVQPGLTLLPETSVFGNRRFYDSCQDQKRGSDRYTACCKSSNNSKVLTVHWFPSFWKDHNMNCQCETAHTLCFPGVDSKQDFCPFTNLHEPLVQSLSSRIKMTSGAICATRLHQCKWKKGQNTIFMLKWQNSL